MNVKVMNDNQKLLVNHGPTWPLAVVLLPPHLPHGGWDLWIQMLHLWLRWPGFTAPWPVAPPIFLKQRADTLLKDFSSNPVTRIFVHFRCGCLNAGIGIWMFLNSPPIAWQKDTIWIPNSVIFYFENFQRKQKFFFKRSLESSLLYFNHKCIACVLAHLHRCVYNLMHFTCKIWLFPHPSISEGGMFPYNNKVTYI